jgi:hypothetical protein
MSLFASVLDRTIDGTSASRICHDLTGTVEPITRLVKILTVPETPLPTRISYARSSSRKETESWSEQEDLRLLAGVHRYGLNAWGSVALFIGNSRQRSQCVQRWARGLDPRISKLPWTEAEDAALMGLVRVYGEKAWTRIATEMGNRCDVQCRYRFRQLSMARDRGSSQDSDARPPVRPMLPSIQSLLAMAHYPEMPDSIRFCPPVLVDITA